ncbi:hypothetical protein BG000_012072 [Podila horticola]|nr:hypothetical protein BG000_012072 [Podila horticola]
MAFHLRTYLGDVLKHVQDLYYRARCLGPHHSLDIVVPVDTRWNSTFHMMERLVRLKKFFPLVVQHFENYSGGDGKVEEVLDLLLSDKDVLPLIHLLLIEIEEVDTPDKKSGIFKFKEAFLVSIKKRFKGSLNYWIASFLHPAYKHLSFLSTLEKRHTHAAVRDQMNIVDLDSWPTRKAETIGTKEKPVFGSSLVNRLMQLDPIVKGKSLQGEVPDETDYDGTEELDRYIKADLVDNHDTAMFLVNEPLKWWSLHMDEYPKISQVARKFLATPATSLMFAKKALEVLEDK